MRSVWQRLLDSFEDFAANTSFHGIPRAFSAHGFKRAVWLLVFFFYFGCFSFQAHLIVTRFQRNDKIVGVELRFEMIAFPSVTVCNLNPFKNSLAREMSAVSATLEAFDTQLENKRVGPRRARDVSAVALLLTSCQQDFSPHPDGSFSCVCMNDGERLWGCGPYLGWQQALCHCESGHCRPSNSSSLLPSPSSSISPCLCQEDFCGVVAHLAQVEAAWPLRLRRDVCPEGASPCYCVEPEESQGPAFCAPAHSWVTRRCWDCSWWGSCRQNDDGDADCICSGTECFRVHETEKKEAPSSVRVRRSSTRLRSEKVLSEYEGLLAVFAHCACEKGNCDVLKKETGEGNHTSPCLCFYNKKSGHIWPCYSPEDWAERRCSRCSGFGDCVLAEGGKALPCLCALPIKMCVRSEESLLTNATHLSDRLVRLWEVLPKPTTTQAPVEVQRVEEAYGYKDVSDPVALKAKATENVIFAVNQLDESQKEALSYSLSEFITKCSFNGRQCSVEDDFVLHIDPAYGNCYVFNSNSSFNKTSERAGANYGLRFQVFVNVTDYLPTTESSGVRLTVHSPDEQPFPDALGHSAPTGFLSSFGIRRKTVTRLPAPYGDCIQQGKNEEFIYKEKTYSTEGCQRSCIQKHLVETCGCGDPRFPNYKNTSNCKVDNPDSRACLHREIRSVTTSTDSIKCKCKQPCSQNVFSVSYSASRWPSSEASLNDCPEGLSPRACLLYYREHGAFIEVFYEQLNYESLEESEAYGFSNLLSDFGGTMGLWLGASVITLNEVGIFLFELVASIFGYRAKKSARPPSLRQSLLLRNGVTRPSEPNIPANNK